MLNGNDNDGAAFQFDNELQGTCLCGVLIIVGHTVRGATRKPAVMHKAPMCADFERLETLVYLMLLERNGVQLVPPPEKRN